MYLITMINTCFVRFSNRRVEVDKVEDESEEVELAEQQRLLQIKQQQEAARQQQLFRSQQQQQQQQLEEQLVLQQQEQQHLRRLLLLKKQQQAESQQHNQWLSPNLVQGGTAVQKKVSCLYQMILFVTLMTMMNDNKWKTVAQGFHLKSTSGQVETNVRST